MSSKTIVCDIDDTIIDSRGNGIDKTISFLKAHDAYTIILVTARNESRRSETVSQLRELGVSYDRLVMNPGSSAPGAARAYKKDAMQSILRNHDVVLAIDNSAQARSAYQSLGVKAVHPRSLNSQSISKGGWQGFFNPIGY